MAVVFLGQDDALDQQQLVLVHVLHGQVTFVLQCHDAEQVVGRDTAEGQAQRFDGVEGARA